MTRRHSQLIAASCAASVLSCAAASAQTPEQRADGNGQIYNPSPLAQEYYLGSISSGQTTTGFIVGAVYPDKASLSWYKFTSDGVSPIIFDTYGTQMSYGSGFGSSNDGELAVYDSLGHYIAGNEGSSTPASGDSNVDPVIPSGAPAPPVKYRQPVDPTKSVYQYGGAWFARNYNGLANLAFVKNPESNPLWSPSNPNYTPYANWNQFSILPAGTYFLAVTGYSTYFSGFPRDASTIDDPNNAVYTNGITSTTPFGFLTFHAMSGTYQLNMRLGGDMDLDHSITANDRRLLRLQIAQFKLTAGIPNQGFLNNDPGSGTWLGLPNDISNPQAELQRYDLTGNQRIDKYDLAAWGRYTANPTSVALTWNNTPPAAGSDPLNPGNAGDGMTWDQAFSQNFHDSTGAEVFFDADSVTFDDNNNGNYAVNIVDAVSPAVVVVNSSSTYSFSGPGSIAGAGALNKMGTGTLLLNTSNSFTGDTTISSGTLLLIGQLASTNVNVTGAGARLVVSSGGVLSPSTNLAVSAGAATFAARSGPRAARFLNSITITNGGKLDISNNDLVLTSTPLATVQAYLAAGSNNGNWNGNGLTSSSAQAASASAHKTAVGYALASSIGAGSFDGQTVPGSAVLVRYTYSGDANLDGAVNALDFNALASSFGASADVWSQGDFNYDGKVNTSDFTLLASNFGQVLPTSSLSAASLVPEPAFCGFVVLTALGMRRTRHVKKQFSGSFARAANLNFTSRSTDAPIAQPPDLGWENVYAY